MSIMNRRDVEYPEDLGDNMRSPRYSGRDSVSTHAELPHSRDSVPLIQSGLTVEGMPQHSGEEFTASCTERLNSAPGRRNNVLNFYLIYPLGIPVSYIFIYYRRTLEKRTSVLNGSVEKV